MVDMSRAALRCKEGPGAGRGRGGGGEDMRRESSGTALLRTLPRLRHWPSDCSILASTPRHNAREYLPAAPLQPWGTAKRVRSADVTQEACSSPLHLLSLYLTYQEGRDGGESPAAP
ncbi:hypothetical protein EYF80_027298 [Liparis tanakae]|uniref:Uncharacterized protein n=1 Tax=Liparis tanakae TaxID=230148 RepID=A0A4Z2HB50_9TELE|nr:hypothetical protein EYF80_027298 [Liparis tanakae]